MRVAFTFSHRGHSMTNPAIAPGSGDGQEGGPGKVVGAGDVSDRGRGGSQRENAVPGSRYSKWWYVITATVVCVSSGAIHEAVGYIAMRRSFRPFITGALILSASASSVWDLLFPVIGTKFTKAGSSPESERKKGSATGTPEPGAASRSGSGSGDRSTGSVPPDQRTVSSPNEKAAGGTASALSHGREASVKSEYDSPGAGRKCRPAIGSWRGWPAVVIFGVGLFPSNLFLDFLLWNWWKYVHGTR